MATARSAEIIAFPARGRFAVAERQADPQGNPIDTRAAARAKAASGSSWYHEEAIREERNLTN
jgi:hypothetical protein